MKHAATIESRALPVLLLLASLALGWILLPFFGTLLWGVTISLLFAPLHRRLLARMPRWRTLAALLTLGMVLLIAVLPFALLTAALTNEGNQIYQRLQAGELDPAGYFRGVFDALPGWITSLLDRFGLVDFDTLQRRLNSALAQGSQFIAGQAYTFGQGTFEFVASLGITLYLAFFGLRDGGAMVAELARASPLSPAHTQALFDKFNTVIGATVKGNLLVAVIQGALGGLAFWALGVSGALLWAVLMAFLSLLPAVGAGLVWAPVAAYFFVTGALWQGVVLVAFGVGVIGLVDNLLRPVLVGKTTLLPDFVVMITTLGGMAVFGLNGFVIGPVIAAMFFALWQLFISDRAPTPAP